MLTSDIENFSLCYIPIDKFCVNYICESDEMKYMPFMNFSDKVVQEILNLI